MLCLVVLNYILAGCLWNIRAMKLPRPVYVLVKSKLQHAPPPRATPRAFDFFENCCSNSPYPGQNAVQMPHTWVHSGDQMPPTRGHFTGTKITEGRRKRLQLSNKIFLNMTKTAKHCIYYGGRPKQVTTKFSLNSLSKLKCSPQEINSREISLHRTITANWKRKRQSLKKG